MLTKMNIPSDERAKLISYLDNAIDALGAVRTAVDELDPEIASNAAIAQDNAWSHANELDSPIGQLGMAYHHGISQWLESFGAADQEGEAPAS